MKILFSSSRDLDKQINQLTKTEIIALINTLNKLSESIEYYENFLKMEDSSKFYVQLLKHTCSYFGIVSIFAIFKVFEFKFKSQKT